MARFKSNTQRKAALAKITKMQRQLGKSMAELQKQRRKLKAC